MPKLSTLAKQVDELSARITSLEKDVRDAHVYLRAQSKQITYLEQVLAKLWAFLYGEQGPLNTLGTTGKKNGHENGKGKESVVDAEQEL